MNDKQNDTIPPLRLAAILLVLVLGGLVTMNNSKGPHYDSTISDGGIDAPIEVWGMGCEVEVESEIPLMRVVVINEDGEEMARAETKAPMDCIRYVLLASRVSKENPEMEDGDYVIQEDCEIQASCRASVGDDAGPDSGTTSIESVSISSGSTPEFICFLDDAWRVDDSNEKHSACIGRFTLIATTADGTEYRTDFEQTWNGEGGYCAAVAVGRRAGLIPLLRAVF